MKDTIFIVKDSLTKNEIKGDFDEHYLSLDGEGFTLQLTADSFKKVQAALRPFTEGEDTSVTPEQHYGPLRKARAARDGAPNPTPEERAAIAAFVEREGLGTVPKGGKVRGSYVKAWSEAGKPGLET